MNNQAQLNRWVGFLAKLKSKVRIGQIDLKTLRQASRVSRCFLLPLESYFKAGSSIDDTELPPNVSKLLVDALTEVGLVFEHCGRNREAESLWDVWYPIVVEPAIDEIRQSKPASSDLAFKLMRSKVWMIGVLIQHRRTVRKQEFGTSQDLLQVVNQCIAYVKDILRVEGSADRSCHATLGRLHFLEGQLKGELALRTEADIAFREAVEHYGKRAGFAKGEKEEVSFRQVAYHRCAKVLIYGSVCLKLVNGELEEAAMTLGAAKIYLVTSQDQMLIAFADFLELCIARAKYSGDTREQLQDVANNLKTSWYRFKEFGHQWLTARAALELSIAHHHLGRLQEAREYLDSAKNFATLSDPWKVHLLLMESRLTRADDSGTAARKAEEALKNAEHFSNPLLSGECRLALAECLFLQGRFDPAAEQCKLAADSNASNMKIIGISSLHLARIYCRGNNIQESNKYWTIWQQAEARIQNGYIAKFARQVQRERSEYDVFTLKEELKNNYHLHERELKKFLLKRAMREHGSNVEKVSESLGISRQTFYSSWKSLLP